MHYAECNDHEITSTFENTYIGSRDNPEDALGVHYTIHQLLFSYDATYISKFILHILSVSVGPHRRTSCEPEAWPRPLLHTK